MMNNNDIYEIELTKHILENAIYKYNHFRLFNRIKSCGYDIWYNFNKGEINLNLSIITKNKTLKLEFNFLDYNVRNYTEMIVYEIYNKILLEVNNEKIPSR